MTWLNIGKSALGLITGIGVGNIIGNIVKNTTPSGLNTFNKISINIGSFVLASMLADTAVKHMNAEIDELVNAVTKVQEKPTNGTETE